MIDAKKLAATLSVDVEAGKVRAIDDSGAIAFGPEATAADAARILAARDAAKTERAAEFDTAERDAAAAVATLLGSGPGDAVLLAALVAVQGGPPCPWALRVLERDKAELAALVDLVNPRRKES